jgi:acylphosphatase
MVQGVGFRYSTRRIAAGFRVAGYVQNRPEGSVLLIAEGETAELDRFLVAVRSQLESYIDDFQQEILPPTGEFAGFAIR